MNTTLRPSLSVIIPTHNREAFIGLAIESVLAQNYPSLEIIVIDDGSTDQTKRVVDSFASAPIHYAYKVLGGPGKARNAALRLAKGEWIAFLDSDDLWAPNKLHAQFKALANNPEAAIVLSNFKFIDEQGKIFNEAVIRDDYQFKGQFLEDYLEGRLPVYTSTLMAKREVFEKVGLFDEEHLIAEDMDLWIKMAANYQFAYVHEPLTAIRKHPGNITAPSRAKTYWAATIMIARHRDILKNKGLSAQKYLVRFFNLAGREALNENSKDKAMNYFFDALKVSPFNLGSYKGLIKTLIKL